MPIPPAPAADSPPDPPITDPDVVMGVPQGDFVLRLHPQRPGTTLRAWDAADTYVLEHIAGQDLAPGRCLVVGDRAGAVAIALSRAGWSVTSMSDSSLAHAALDINQAANESGPAGGSPVATVRSTTTDPGGPFDLVVVKIPKSVAMLEDQLRRLRPALAPAAVVVGAGMTRHVHTSTTDTFERIIGPTTTSLARRKARLIHCTPDPALDPGTSPFPTTYSLEDGSTVVSHADVFSQGRLDIGTRLLLENLPGTVGISEAVDLGCGDGVVGLMLARANPGLHLTFIDESYMAVQSAEQTMAANLPGRDDTFVIGDGMAPLDDESVDLVVLNPPFHDDHSMGDAIAWDMFTGARRALRPGGRLIVVGNRHLAYHAKLARLFGGSRTVASTTKFVVLSATRKGPRS